MVIVEIFRLITWLMIGMISETQSMLVIHKYWVFCVLPEIHLFMNLNVSFLYMNLWIYMGPISYIQSVYSTIKKSIFISETNELLQV